MEIDQGHAQGKAQDPRGSEIIGDQCPDIGNSEERPRNDGPSPRSIGFGNVGTVGARASIAGGILTRLIQDTADRLNDARECIAWYQREEQKQLERLAEYEALARELEAPSAPTAD